jgi:hypothetical protein
MDNLKPPERETVINMSDGDTVVRIWTAQRRVITQCRRRPEFKELRSGHDGTTEWAEFEIADEDFRFSVKKRMSLTPEQRQAAAERMRTIRPN